MSDLETPDLETPDLETPDRRVTDLRTQIVSLHQRLSALPRLDPGPAVNALFGELVRVCAYRPGEDADPVLADPTIAALTPQLRQLCANGEYQLERAWAQDIIAAERPDTRLAAFPYRANYEELTTLERHVLAGVGLDLGRVRRVCFLGGGPLPLSALMLSRDLAVPVDVVDLSAEATALGAEVARRLSPSAPVHFHQGEAGDFSAVADSDVVVLAALVGLDRASKNHILEALSHRMRPGSLLLARSAHGLRTLLYPPLDLPDQPGWRLLAALHPFNTVVNSVVVMARQ